MTIVVCILNNKSKPLTRETGTINRGVRQSHYKTRTKLQTATVTCSKAQSADGARADIPKYTSPPAAFMCLHKLGKLIASVRVTPVVAQALPDTCANVNIPIKNGVLLLRPKKLVNDYTGILEDIEPGTLDHLKKLNTLNLNKIVTLGDQKESAITAQKRDTYILLYFPF